MLLFSRFGSAPSFSSDRGSRKSFGFFESSLEFPFWVEILSRIGGPD